VFRYIGVLLIFLSLPVLAEQLMSKKSFLKNNLSSYKKLTQEKFKVDGKQKERMQALAENAEDSSVAFYFGKSDEDKIESACTVIPQRGKEGPMQIGVCFSREGLVSAIELLEFNEDRGQKAKERGFLDQFIGKSHSKNKVYPGQEIHGVSGATYTSEYISEGVRKASYFFSEFVKEKL
tara:strand:- start:25949 stop:26485 length:537 start_codon:yes stop_codon:yes gene_type:complete